MVKNKRQTVGRKRKTAAAKRLKTAKAALKRRESAARALDDAVRDAAVRPHRASSTSCRRSTSGFAANRKEIAAIAGNQAAPTFANTIDALERSGDALDRVSSVFFNLAATDTNAEIQAIERALAPRFAKHGMRIYQDETLFARVDALFKKRKKLELSEEQARVLERYHRAFVKSGAGLDAEGQEAAGGDRRSACPCSAPHFSQNLLADEQAFVLVLEGEADLAGLPEAVRAAAAQTAKRARPPGQARHHAGALQRRAVPAVFGPARSAREGVQGLDHARRQRRQDRQPQDRGRDPGAAGRARAAAGLQDGGRLGARVLHGQDARRRAQAADGGVGPGARARAARSATSCRRRRRPKAATSSSPPGTGATTPRRCARPSSTSTTARSSPTCSSTTSSPPPSTWRASCSASPSPSARTCPSITPRCAPSR